MNKKPFENENGLIYFCDHKRHLICLPYSPLNLHKMAEDLGIKRCWFHKNHYNIPKSRFEEVKKKCLMTTNTRDLVILINSAKQMEKGGRKIFYQIKEKRC
jgi:hypothetical protein